MKNITLCIAGDVFDVVYDGVRVTSPEFPNDPLEYTAPCGIKITQEMLLSICKQKSSPEHNHQPEINDNYNSTSN